MNQLDNIIEIAYPKSIYHNYDYIAFEGRFIEFS